MSVTVPSARRLSERYCPNTGVPLRLGKVWPPRLVVHDVTAKGRAPVNEAIASVYVRHELRRPVEVIIRPGNAPAHDPSGNPIPGLSIGRSARMVDKAGRWELMPITLQWTPELQQRLQVLPWVRKELVIDLKDGKQTRSFHWYAYLTPDPPQLPRHASLYDDHPHYRWVTHDGEPLRVEGVSDRWIELPAPMSSPALTPACWVQARRLAEGPPGPETLEILPIFPLEPAVPSGAEVAGWNGALGGHDRRPMLLPLAIESRPGKGGLWYADLDYWDTPLQGHSGPLQHVEGTPLERPTACVWPRVTSAETQPIELHQLRNPTEKGREVKLNLRVRLSDDAEPIRVERGEVLLGGQRIGSWLGGPLDLYAGREWSLPCVVNQDRIAEAGHERLKLTLAFHGVPSRGICAMEQVFRTENGPYVCVRRARYVSGRSRRPWLVIDLGTEGTAAAVAFLDGFAPRVLTVQFAEGPIHPSRVYVSPGQGGAWTLTDQPGEDALYTTGIKLGLRFGDGAHPGCPDHVSAIDVARFYLKRFLLELRERAAWFPLEECDVLVSFPPRLACMPRFVGAMKEAFGDVIPEVLWPDGRHGRIRFREEAFLVAMPALHKDLELQPLPAGGSRFYWVMDFGGGTTDVCGFLCTADEFQEEHTISHFTYPQRFPHHLSGNDVTAAFYTTLRSFFVVAGVVAGTGEAKAGRQFVFPEDPFPSTRSTHTALLNQTALRELADICKCTPPAAQAGLTVRDVAKSLRSTTVRSVDDVATTLVALLGDEAASLGRRTLKQLHQEVIDPTGARVTASGAPTRTAAPGRATGETATVTCIHCAEPHVLPVWVFSSNRAFRYRCRSCGKAQQVRGLGDTILPEGTDDDAPTILAWQDVERDATRQLLLKQDHQNYRVQDWDTVRRWISERRVGPDDLVSETGVVWDRLRDRVELADLFGASDPDDASDEWTDPGTEEEPAAVRAPLPVAGVALGEEIERFLEACQQALDGAFSRLPEHAANAEVVVLLAGRASRFQPIADGVHTAMRGRVVHLTNDWVRRVFGTTGAIDPGAGLKTLTVNGGGVFALHQTHTDTAPLLLSFDTDRVDCDTWLDTGARQPFLLTRELNLAVGARVPLVDDSAHGPTLPSDHPLLGEVRLQLEGLPQDRSWEPWVTVGRGTLRRVAGHRPRRTAATMLETREGAFVLTDLTQGVELVMEDLLPRLELLGEEKGG